MQKPDVNVIDICNIGGGDNFETLWSLPSFPVTEMFGDFELDFPSIDQELTINYKSGHVQLRNQVDPSFLYTSENYSYRSHTSKKTARDSQKFLNFFNRVADRNYFMSAVDIGGNDLFLAKKVINKVKRISVIDPICEGLDGQIVDGVNVYGKMVENVDIGSEIGSVDLVFCRHTLEHIARPIDLLEQLFKQCSDDCIYFFEVPCLQNMLEALRFDAVFHQHLSYFDIHSFKFMLNAAGGEYIYHEEYHQGPVGGSLLVAFRKARSLNRCPLDVDVSQRIKYIENKITSFSSYMRLANEALAGFSDPVFGYGAGLMLATLGYHLKTDFSKMVCILDDDCTKAGLGYKNVDVEIRFTETETINPNSSFLITSMENVRPIFGKINSFNPRRIICPLIC